MNVTRFLLLGAALLGSLFTVPSCGATARTSGTDSNTHWLRECDDDASCGPLKCVCGVCSEHCSMPSDCRHFGDGATCAVPETCQGAGSPSACVLQQVAGSGGGAGQAASPGNGGGPEGGGASGGQGVAGSGEEPAAGGAATAECPPGQVALEVYPLVVFNSRPDECIDRSEALHAGCAEPSDLALDVPAGFPFHTCVRHVSSPSLPSCCQLYVTSTPLPSAEGWEECSEADAAYVEGARDCSTPACESGGHRAAQYDAERACLRTSVHVGCAELIDPSLAIPDDWPATQCVRRLSDDLLFLAGQPVRASEWAECTLAEAQTLANASLCD